MVDREEPVGRLLVQLEKSGVGALECALQQALDELDQVEARTRRLLAGELRIMFLY